jgi:predicted adenylyl cyclase CyaB
MAALEARLIAAGAEKVVELLEVNTFFDTPKGDLKAADEGLRVRLETSTDGSHVEATITHKGPRAHGRIKTRAESEVVVADAHAAAQLLIALGYVSVLSFEKRRRRWKLDGCRVEVDTLPYLGDFVEIEGPTEAAVLAVRRRLDLDHLPMISASYISMLVTYLSENAIRAEHVGFESGAGSLA